VVLAFRPNGRPAIAGHLARLDEQAPERIVISLDR
jgi:hypothetical protein